MRIPHRNRARRALQAALVAAALAASGCGGGRASNIALTERVALAARPILALDPDANWTESFNELIAIGPAAALALAARPELTRPTAPDDLPVFTRTSLIAALLHPSEGVRVSGSCFTTTLSLLHVMVHVRGRSVGDLVWRGGPAPRRWHDLFPAEFNHAVADEIDVERDRQAIRAWLARRRGEPSSIRLARSLAPRVEHLWHLLGRRLADEWFLPSTPDVIRCARPGEPALLRAACVDYNLVRAACIWLGSRDDPDVESRLIGLVASDSPVIAHNARFALRYSPDERIRRALEAFPDDRAPTSPPPPDASVPQRVLRFESTDRVARLGIR